MNARRDKSGRWPLGNLRSCVLGRWPRLEWNGALPLMNRAVGAHDSCAPFVGRCPTLGLNGPLALRFSANGAPPSQPGATPQVKGRKQNEG
jgi:hypothetical protein